MDLKTELQNFKAINLEEITKGETQIPDNIRNSVYLYNKAIESLKTGSEDIAVIELKKAVAMNPEFYEAMNLLGICYNYLGEKEKAAEVFDRVMKGESNSIMAMNYLQQFGLNESVQLPKSRNVKKPVQQPPQQQPGEPLKRIRTNKSEATVRPVKKQGLIEIIKIGAGFAAGILLAVLIFSILPEKENSIAEPPEDHTNPSVSMELDKYQKDYEELKEKFDLLQKDKEDVVKQSDYYKATIKLYEISILSGEKKYESAADMLLLMKTVVFKDKEKELFDNLYKSVMPQAAKYAYDQGYKLYNNKKYQESLEKLEKVQVYDPEFNKMDAVLYYTGRCCQALQDSRSAVALFQKLIDSYPRSAYLKSAKARLNELTKIP